MIPLLLTPDEIRIILKKFYHTDHLWWVIVDQLPKYGPLTKQEMEEETRIFDMYFQR